MCRSPGGAGADIPYRPRLAFMIVGAQKCGTTALARFLAAHPRIAVTSPKEAHLFDAPEYSREWTPADIDERYRRCFDAWRFAGAVLGDATPIYLYLDDGAAELGRYNPDLKVVLLLRSEDLREHHDAVLRRVFGFLGVSRGVRVPREIVFQGARGDRRHLIVSWLLRLSYAAESRRMLKLLGSSAMWYSPSGVPKAQPRTLTR